MIDMFPLLFNHLQRTEQLMPKYIGKFDGVDALPRREYPPIYWWEDVSIGKLRLSCNTPLLEDMCAQLAAESGIFVSRDDSAIESALERLRELSSHAFEAMIRAA